VEVTIGAEDLSNPANKMKLDEYHFTIKNDLPDLYLESFDVDITKVMVNKPIVFNSIFGVDTVSIFDPIQLQILDNERVIIDTTFSSMQRNEIHSYTRSVIFRNKGKHDLKIVLDPQNNIKEANEQNNVGIQTIEVTEGELLVRSNPFTPNGDGINDIVTFNFEKLSVSNPSLLLYDVSGRLMLTLSERRGYSFVWDGTDRYGNQAQPGVYLYLLQDQNRTIANGYIVLAR
jgi:gliding motility-associated-like protein